MRGASLAVCAALSMIPMAVSAEPSAADEVLHPTVTRQQFMRDMLADDLHHFLDGRKSSYDWSRIAVPYVRDAAIAVDFMHSPIGADAKYRNKVTFVNGYFAGAERSIGNQFSVQMQMVVAYVNVSESAFLEQAKPGDRINMACIVQGKGVEFVEMDSCVDPDAAIKVILDASLSNTLKKPMDMDRFYLTSMAIQFDKMEPQDTLCRQGDDMSCIADMNNMSDRLQASLIAWGKANASSLKPLLKGVLK